jgi:hypothetical protein
VNVRVVVIAALMLTGCFGGSNTSDRLPATESNSTFVADSGPAPAVTKTCPLTLPNGSMPPADNDVGANHGNGDLWTTMWPHNVVIATPDYIEADGSVGMKWPWWRGTRGKLTITGRRLDGDAPPLEAGIPDGYGPIGFVPSGILFPTEGCWEVTGTVGEARLTFVTLVVKAAWYWPLAENAGSS